MRREKDERDICGAHRSLMVAAMCSAISADRRWIFLSRTADKGGDKGGDEGGDKDGEAAEP